MKKILLGTMAAVMLTPMAVPSAAFAQPNQWHGDDRNWDPSHDYRDDRRNRHSRKLGRDDQVYRGGDGRYYCKRNDGTTGTVIGAVGGGLAGNLLGGGTLGTLLGAGGGALLGRSIDRGKVKCR